MINFPLLVDSLRGACYLLHGCIELSTTNQTVNPQARLATAVAVHIQSMPSAAPVHL